MLICAIVFSPANGKQGEPPQVATQAAPKVSCLVPAPVAHQRPLSLSFPECLKQLQTLTIHGNVVQVL